MELRAEDKQPRRTEDGEAGGGGRGGRGRTAVALLHRLSTMEFLQWRARGRWRGAWRGEDELAPTAEATTRPGFGRTSGRGGGGAAKERLEAASRVLVTIKKKKKKK